ncbi:MAG: 30S ribosomal protein S4 [Candidatus Aenigmatarchaeota archaeon]
MKRQRKKYSRPKRPWDKDRIKGEKKLLQEFGLRRKKEIWRAEAILRDFRRRARELAAHENKEQEALLLNGLFRLGLIKKDASLDDVLGLTVERLLERRLQTLVLKKGLANTQKQARQYIVHGHIAVKGRRTRWPSILVTTEEEATVKFYSKSPIGVKK